MQKAPQFFFDCFGNGVQENEIYFVVTEDNKILSYISLNECAVEEELTCFKFFKDARDITIKFQIEQIIDTLKNEVYTTMFNHDIGFPNHIKNDIKRLNTLSNRLRSNNKVSVSI